jgi:type I restriction enzyme M protein
MPKLSLAKLERHLYAAADRLRQEGLDAATYKDFIFGMLFLKRCSDVFDAEWEKIVGRKVEQGMIKKEAFEQSNAPDDADEEELANWNYAKDLERQARELKAEHKDALKELAKLEKAAAKIRTAKNNSAPLCENDPFFPPSPSRRKLEGGGPLCAIKTALQPVLDRLAAIEAELTPYEQIKIDLAEARARYRKLTDAFVGELKNRCGGLSEDKKRILVLELFAQDVQTGLDAAVAEKQQELVRFVEGLWDKYRVTLADLRHERAEVETRMENYLKQLAYTDSFVRD